MLAEQKPDRLSPPTVLTLRDLETKTDPKYPYIHCYPYVGNNWYQQKLINMVAEPERDAFLQRCQSLLRYLPWSPPLTPEQLAHEPTRDWPALLQNWVGTPLLEPYCATAESQWRTILAAPDQHTYDYVLIENLPVYIRHPQDVEHHEKLLLDRSQVAIKFKVEQNGIVVIADRLFITTALLRDVLSQEVFVLLARPAQFPLDPYANMQQVVQLLPSSKLVTTLVQCRKGT